MTFKICSRRMLDVLENIILWLYYPYQINVAQSENEDPQNLRLSKKSFRTIPNLENDQRPQNDIVLKSQGGKKL